jgi:hypothetical protein
VRYLTTLALLCSLIAMGLEPYYPFPSLVVASVGLGIILAVSITYAVNAAPEVAKVTSRKDV